MLRQLNASADGLTGAEVERRLAEWGPNRLPEPPKDSLFKRIFKHFDDVLIYICSRRPCARRSSASGWTDLAGMVFLGIVGIVDPPRPEAIETIATSHPAGIDVKMITGDRLPVQRAVAAGVGQGAVPDPGASQARHGVERRVGWSGGSVGPPPYATTASCRRPRLHDPLTVLELTLALGILSDER